MRFCHGKRRAHLTAHERGEPARFLVGCAHRFQHHHVAVVGRRRVEHDGAEDGAVHLLVANRHADPADAQTAIFRLDLQAPKALSAGFGAHGSEDVLANVFVGIVGSRVGFKLD